MNLTLNGEVAFDKQGMNLRDLTEIATHIQSTPPHPRKGVNFVKGAIEARDPYETEAVLDIRR